MLRERTYITIEQNSEGRNKKMYFDFCHSWDFANNWEDLSAKGSLVLPKKVYYVDLQTRKKISLYGANKFLKDQFRKGDKIKIESRYIHWDENLNEKQTPLITIVEGYINGVKAELPIEISFEDNMFLLKKTPMPNKAYAPGQSIESILQEAIKLTNSTFGVNFKVNVFSDTTGIENTILTSQNETIAEWLAKLKKEANVKVYFRGDELRVGHLLYIEQEAQTKIFEFQNNIISSDLEFKLKKDTVLSAVASNHITEVNGTTKQGKPKTKNKRIEVLVTFRDGLTSPITKFIKEGDKPDPNVDGERRTFIYPDAKNEADLIVRAAEDLKKYYYDGFKGKFTTFGTPHVQFGDNAQLVNKYLPEQNGLYKIKGVEWSGGVDGYRQVITLDYKLNV